MFISFLSLNKDNNNDFENLSFDQKKLNLLKTLDQEKIQELSDIYTKFMNPQTKLLNIKDVVNAMKLLDSTKQIFLIISIFDGLDKKYENTDLDFTNFVIEVDKSIVKIYLFEIE